MTAQEFLNKAILVGLSVVAINQGLSKLINYNLIESMIPAYSKWVFIGVGAAGGWVVYNLIQAK